MKVNIRYFLDPPKIELQKEDPVISLDNVDNSSSTSDLYKQRSSYKEQVNDKNLPIGNKNSLGQNLNNQLDTWYKRPNYAKYNNKGKLIVPTPAAELTKFESGFELLNFVADAAEELFREYNVARNPHPESRLNNITILRAYEEAPSYEEHLNKIYESFFNDILDPIKHSNQIKDIKDFINLFYNWFTDQDLPATRFGFVESSEYTIYNTGLAFDFFNVQTEKDKEAILNDVRWPVLNYVAKVNGFRVDPNNPGTLIADIRSSKLIEKYAAEYFKGEEINDVPEKILERYFTRVSGFDESRQILQDFILDFARIYNRFIKKYTAFTDYNAEDDIRQLFKKEFKTNKVARKEAKLEDFEKLRSDGKKEIDKYIIEIYTKMRLKENDIVISEKQIQKLISRLGTVQSIISSKGYADSATFVEKIYTNAQPLNILEAFISSQKAKSGNNKKSYVFLWDDGKRQALTGTEEFATLVQEDDEGLIFSEVPEDPNPFS